MAAFTKIYKLVSADGSGFIDGVDYATEDDAAAAAAQLIVSGQAKEVHVFTRTGRATVSTTYEDAA